MSDGYLIGPRLLGRIEQLVDAGVGAGDAGGTAAPGGRPFVFVRVTGGAAPWWTGVVTVLSGDGTWQDLGGCEVATAAGPLKAGPHKYLCVRTGGKADGTPRFVAVMAPLVARSVVTSINWTACTHTTATGYFVDA